MAKELGIDKGDTFNISANAEAEANTEEAMEKAVISVLSKLEVLDFADQVIREQKYQYAANGMINTNMIAKELGIDKGDTFNISANAEAEANTEEAMEKAVISVLSKLKMMFFRLSREVLDFADQVIREQKYQYAANGMINTNMIAKELGIDKGDTFNISANAEAEANTEEAMEKAVISVLSKL
ncbi:terminase small subunit [Citrobacter phage HCF1]|uniref:Terminase small subunit n=1 Tax=Citrobacter phage HCF1 TaxID=2849700 RepID=A0ABX6D3K6_9CAUD|nr:terminase small subunit [Citrobacter phage HCF1]